MYDDAITALENFLIGLKKENIAALIRKNFEESGYIKAIRQLLDVSMEQSIAFVSDPYGRSFFFASILITTGFLNVRFIVNLYIVKSKDFVL